MADDKTKRGAPDRRLVNREEPYELDTVAREFKVTRDEVRDAQRKAGPSREAVEAELRRRARR
jgi:DNA-directed RNA polymerase sigma subunit (sigma70/sigma32)